VFDFRYHVASLAAVFVALVIGILVGVGLSGKGFVDDAERENLTNEIAALKRERDDANELLEAVDRRQRAVEDYAASTYPVLVDGRLQGRRVVLLFVGSVDEFTPVSLAIERAVERDADGRIVRLRALRVPVDSDAIGEALRRRPLLASLAAPDAMDDVGKELARELVAGGRTPVWDALAGTLVDEQEGAMNAPADAVIVARPELPQRGATAELLSALYETLSRSGLPAVGVEREGRTPSAIPAFRAAGLSTVDSVDTPAGGLALVLLLAGADHGSYGVEETARDGILPPVPQPSEQP
jgi:hypothetical protein